MKIMIWQGKHSDVYYDISTKEKWAAACEDLLSTWIHNYEYILKPENPVELAANGYKYGPISTEDIEWAAKNPADAGPVSDVTEPWLKKVKAAKSKVDRAIGAYQAELGEYELALSMSNSENRAFDANNVPLAWKLVDTLRGTEYMEVRIERLVDATAKN